MTADFFQGKRVLVTGGTGMIGVMLGRLLTEKGAKLRLVSLDDGAALPLGADFLKLDLTRWENCQKACQDMDLVFHLAGIKGGVGIGRSKAALFLEANALINLHMLKAAREEGVKRYLFTSTIGVYPDGDLFREDSVWDQPPHRSDWYGAWGKRWGELQCQAYYEQYGYESVIVRPANVYGPFDNFNPETAMVVAALMGRLARGENPLRVWGDGSAVRDFIYSKDCARGMMLAMEKAKPADPINLGSGSGVSIRTLVDTLVSLVPGIRVEWDGTKPMGNKVRLMDVSKAKKEIGFEVGYSLELGVKETFRWLLENNDKKNTRYSIFESAEKSAQ